MKQFLIYQFFIDKNYNEKNLLVGIAKAESESEAINKYVDAKYKDDHKHFIKGYLSAQETKVENITDEILQSLPKNAQKLGAWYLEGLINEQETNLKRI